MLREARERTDGQRLLEQLREQYGKPQGVKKNPRILTHPLPQVVLAANPKLNN